MMKRIIIVLCGLLLLVAWSIGSIADDAKQEEKKAEYVGAKKCKMCHKDQHASWLETKHAKAYDALKPEEKKVDSCVVCHVTGFGVADTLFEGVQCEACHGPGSLYKSTSIMSKKKYEEDYEAQHKLALEAGLIIPDEKVCVTCHNKKSPNFKEFDFEKAKATGLHKMKTEEAKPDSAKG